MLPRTAGWIARVRTPYVLAFALVAAPVGAQQPVANTMSVQPGSRVRAWGADTAAPPIVGTTLAATGSGFRIARDRDTVDLQHVSRIQESDGRHGHALAGVIVGAIAVGGTFAIVGAAESSCKNEPFCLVSPGLGAGVLGGLGAAAGALVGGITGAVIRTERWHDVPLTRAASHIDLRFVPMGSRGRQVPGIGVRIGVG